MSDNYTKAELTDILRGFESVEKYEAAVERWRLIGIAVREADEQLEALQLTVKG